MPTTSSQFSNFLILTNDDAELRDEGIKLFAEQIDKAAYLSPTCAIIHFKDGSVVMDDNGGIQAADDVEEFCHCLISWGLENPANRKSLNQFVEQIKAQPQS